MRSKKHGVLVAGRLRNFAWKEGDANRSPVVIDCDWVQFMGATTWPPKPPDRADARDEESKMPPENGKGK